MIGGGDIPYGYRRRRRIELSGYGGGLLSGLRFNVEMTYEDLLGKRGRGGV